MMLGYVEIFAFTFIIVSFMVVPLVLLSVPFWGLFFLCLFTKTTRGWLYTAFVWGTMRIGIVILKVLRWHLDTFWTFLQLRVFLPYKSHTAHDNKYVMAGTQMHRVRYGSLGSSLESTLVLSPCKDDSSWSGKCEFECNITGFNIALSSVKDLPAPPPSAREHIIGKSDSNETGGVCLYIHGGGFVAANATVLVQSVTPLVRAGLQVYAIDYPLAPEEPFPSPVLSVLRALHWLRNVRGVTRCQVYGDSAGAALGGLATALVCNPNLLVKFLREAESTGSFTGSFSTFPTIDSVALVYGVLDTDSWRLVRPLESTGRSSSANSSSNGMGSDSMHGTSDSGSSASASAFSSPVAVLLQTRSRSRSTSTSLEAYNYITDDDDEQVALPMWCGGVQTNFLSTISRLEHCMAVLGLHFVCNCHFETNPGLRSSFGDNRSVYTYSRDKKSESISSPKKAAAAFTGMKNFADMVPQCSNLPPCFLVCGDKDPLILSSIKVYGLLRQKGFKCTLSVHPVRHAFVGLPPAWISEDLRRVASQVSRQITMFLLDGSK